MKPFLRVMLGLCIVVLLSGCGKTLEQIKQAAHSIIDIAGKTYEDIKDNVETTKKAVLPAEPEQSK